MKTFNKVVVLLSLVLAFSLCLTLGASAQGEVADTETPEAVETIISAPETVTATSTESTITLKWTAVDGATGYRIYYKSGNAWKVAVSTTSKTTHSFTKLKAGTKYTFAVRPYVKNGSAVIWSNYTQVETAVKAVAPSKITSQQNASAIKLSWTASAGATGYRIYYKSGNAWKVAVSTTSAISHTFSGLKVGAKFTFAVRPYVKNGSAVIWSDFTTYTAATVPATPKATATSSLGGQVVVSWNAVSGANGYQLYYKVNNGAYKLYKEYTSAQKLTFKNLTRGATYTFAVRAFVNTSGGKVLSAYKEASTVIAYKIDRYNKVFESGNFIMQVNDPDLGVVTMGLKNGNVYVEANVDDLTLKLLYLKSYDKTYMILDSLKMYGVMPEEYVSGVDWASLAEELKTSDKDVGTVTTAKINGKTYDCEIFKNSKGETYRYYFSGDTLVFSDSVAKDGTVERTEFKKVAANPSDSYFKIPSGYSYVDISWMFVIS